MLGEAEESSKRADFSVLRETLLGAARVVLGADPGGVEGRHPPMYPNVAKHGVPRLARPVHPKGWPHHGILGEEV